MNALQIATEALAKIEAHEAACERKYDNLTTTTSKRLDVIQTGIDKLFDRFWLMALGVIAVLLGVSGYLYVESSRVNREFSIEITKILSERGK